MESEKRRAAEAAHALRTPVAVLVARLGNLPDDPALAPIRDDVKALAPLALTNLIENAVFHGGGGPVEVQVGPGPVINVSDTGPGLPAGHKDQLFEPFWRGDAAPKGGAGLGLAIVARIQRAHAGRVQAGRVQAATRPGGGAIFSLVYKGISPAPAQ